MKTINFDKVADLYDLYVNVDFDIPFFMNEADKAGGRALELMCGTGRVSIPLIEAGVDLTCVDYSAGMLEVFNRKIAGKGLNARLVNMDVTKLSLGEKYPLIFIPFNSFSEITGRGSAEDALRLIHSHLEDGGVFICTLQNPAVRLQAADGQMRVYGGFPMPGGGTVVISYYNNFRMDTGIVNGRQFYEIYDKNSIMTSKRLLEINFRIYYKDEFEKLAEDSGFGIIKLSGNYDYSDFFESQSPYMIWFFEKKQA